MKSFRDQIVDRVDFAMSAYGKYEAPQFSNNSCLCREITHRKPEGWDILFNEDLIPEIINIQRGIGDIYYPETYDIFNAFRFTPLLTVKVVIVGQEPSPYGTDEGLSFSCSRLKPVPKPLQNIYKELHRSIDGFRTPSHPDLTEWCAQGVLLLNTELTVLHGQPKSHKGKWRSFFLKTINAIYSHNPDTIFMLWGRCVEKIKDHKLFKFKNVLLAGHPSPTNTTNPFVGCNHFVLANEMLEKMGVDSINWILSED